MSGQLAYQMESSRSEAADNLATRSMVFPFRGKPFEYVIRLGIGIVCQIDFFRMLAYIFHEIFELLRQDIFNDAA